MFTQNCGFESIQGCRIAPADHLNRAVILVSHVSPNRKRRGQPTGSHPEANPLYVAMKDPAPAVQHTQFTPQFERFPETFPEVYVTGQHPDKIRNNSNPPRTIPGSSEPVNLIRPAIH